MVEFSRTLPEEVCLVAVVFGGDRRWLLSSSVRILVGRSAGGHQ